MENQTTVSHLQEQIADLQLGLQAAERRIAHEIAAREQVEQERTRSEGKYKALVENSHDVVYAVGLDGKFSYISSQIAQYGYTSEDWIDNHVLELLAPEHREESWRAFKELVKTGASTPGRFQIQKKDGSRNWVEVVANTTYDESGKPVERVGIMRDIQERKQKEEANRSLILLLDTLDAECFIKDKDGIYQYINRAFETQFGMTREEVIGKDDVFVFGAETAEMLRENDQRIMATKEPEAVEESTTLEGGKFVVYLTNKTPIIDENGDVTGICGVGVDITHQKEIEDRLRQSEEKYRSLVEQISEVIYAVNNEGVITYISPAIESILGYSPAEVIGKPVTDYILPEELPRVTESFQRLYIGRTPRPTAPNTVTKSGETRWMQTSSQPVLEGDQVMGVQGVMIDITDRKTAETQLTHQAASAERERLARELHDSVTQTLYSVAAIAEALPRIWERNQEEARVGLGELETLTHAALAEMRTLLLELRPEALEKQNLGELLHRLINGLMGRTRMPIKLSVDEDCALPADVQLALYRITQEALNNVVKHARASQAQVRLECEAGLVKLTIKDDGVGFNPQSVTSHRLGLEIMPERALEIDAEFEINSQPDMGTTISVAWQDNGQG